MYAAVIDIGKPGKNLGWFIDGPRSCEGDDIDACVNALGQALKEDALALGFEAPMFVPMRKEPTKLLMARDGECLKGYPNRPFSAGAGSAVLVAALVIVPYVLSQLKARVPDPRATLDWRSPPSDPRHVLLFEAFVTDQRKAAPTRHVEDARLAVQEFQRRIRNPAEFESDVTAADSFNLLGAMMLRTGWSADPGLLREPCLVVRANAPNTSPGSS